MWGHALRSPGWSPGEAFYFFSTPLLLAWAAYGLAPDQFERTPGLLPLAIAVPYLAAGYSRPRPTFAVVGAAAAGIAAGEEWDGLERVWMLLGLALLWPALDHPLQRNDGRWYGLITLAAALEHLFNKSLAGRTAADTAFVGRWARALWGTIAVTAALAAGLWRVDADREDTRQARPGLWIVAGGMALFGVTGEIRRYFDLQGLSAETASLAAGSP